MRVPAAGGSPLAVVLMAAAIAAALVLHLGDIGLAALGMVILGVLLAVSAPQGLRGELAARWARRQLPALTAGAVTAGVVLAALTFRPPDVVWAVLAGAAAAAAAYLVAVPRGPRTPPSA